MKNQRKVSVTGLGFVGLSIAAAFGKAMHIMAYDIDKNRVNELRNHHDRNHEIPANELKNIKATYTTDPHDLAAADFHIISLPTPLKKERYPDLSILLNATKILGKIIKKNDIIVFSSTVYPGVTEDQCIPILEKESSMKYGKDFFVGYSPERINPSDPEHNFFNINKIIAANDRDTLSAMYDVYKMANTAEIFPVQSIRVAEATKVIENTQRDVNIAFMNAISVILHNLGIDSTDVYAAMKTKWNHLNFYPGLVGGSCIGNNPYYLLYALNQRNYPAEMIESARNVNEHMENFLAEQLVKQLLDLNIEIIGSRIGILGFAYKANCADIRNTRVIKLIEALEAYHIEVFVYDPFIDIKLQEKSSINFASWEEFENFDALILTVAHDEFLKLKKEELINKFRGKGVFMNLSEKFDSSLFNNSNIKIWRI